MKRNTNSKTLNRIGKTISAQTKAAVSRIKTSVSHHAPLSSPEETQKRVEEKAYEIFQRRSLSGGSECFDWSLAEDFVKLECAPKKGKIKPTISEEELKNLTAQKAYEIFQRKCCADGSEKFDWTIAEELIRLEQAAKN